MRLDIAIDAAEHRLARRLATAAAWRNAADLERTIEVLQGRCREAGAALGTAVTLAAIPSRPLPEAELEAVQHYVGTLRRLHDDTLAQLEGLRNRAQSRRRAVALGGALVQARDAGERLEQLASERNASALAALRAHRDAELAKAGLRLEDLSGAVRALIEAAEQDTSSANYQPSITRWIALDKQRRDGIARALTLLQCAPELAQDDPGLARRWEALKAHLQRIAGGLEPFTAPVEREHEQVLADAARLVNAAFTRADWIRAMGEQGFEVLERMDGDGLIVVDLDHPEAWLEATEYETEQGGFAATLELRTEAEFHTSDSLDQAVTDDICGKLARASRSSAPTIATEASVIEHDRRIKRARRPAAARKTFAQGL